MNPFAIDGQWRIWWKTGLIGLGVFFLYYTTRSPCLDEFDSVNFALGVSRQFNLWENQPHAPGYPLFIWLGQLAHTVLGVGPETSLHFLSAAGGAAFIAIWFAIIRLQSSEKLGWWVAGSLVLTPGVWMTSTKVLSDSPAAALVSAQILSVLFFLRTNRSRELLIASLLGAAAAGIRPQLILVVLAVQLTGLAQSRAPARRWFMAIGLLLLGCLLWLVPMIYLQWRLRPEMNPWLVYPKLAYKQWQWRLDKPGTYIGAGDWSPLYLGTRIVYHTLGWFGHGFGFLASPLTVAAGALLVIVGVTLYFRRANPGTDRAFWRFHAPWATTHFLVIFISLPAAQRYYLLMFPLLHFLLLRGLLSWRVRWSWPAVALPLLLLYIVVPFAIQNHREESPAVRLVRYLQNKYPVAARKDVVLLFFKARRHVEWYAPEFTTISDQPPTTQELSQAAAVYTDDQKAALPAGWHRSLEAVFARSAIIYVKDYHLELFRVEPNSPAK